MRKQTLLAFILALSLILAGCQPAAAPEPTAAPTAVPTAAEVLAPELPALTVLSGEKSLELTLDELLKLPAVEGYAGIKSSTGKITPPALFKGVLIADLLKDMGGLTPELGVQIEAEDGYSITYSADQITEGDFITYDPVTGDEVQGVGPLQVILAYEMDGQPLDAKRDGQLRVAVISADKNQVVDGHWAVKWVSKLTVKDMGEEWTLVLDGAITQEIDRGTFESGAAENCHKATWTDDKAQEWTGIPLWLLVGYVDDEIKHNGPAFNDALADAGYTVEVVAKDGYSVTFDSARVKRNDNMIVAYLMNGNPLTEKDFPLHLVGSDAAKKDSIGSIAQIIVHLDAKPAAEAAPTEEPKPTEAAPAPAAEVSGDFVITGMVETPTGWMIDDLKKLEVVQLSVEHPKKGKMDVEGVLLKTLFDVVKVKAEAATLVLTASDGYTAEAKMADVLACKDCLVQFTEDGKLNAVMPGLESSTWVKEIVKFEIK